MKVPLSWLKTYVDIEIPVEELANRLTLAGLEVEAIEQIGEDWDPAKVVVGQIRQVKPHPNADRLCLAVVDYGADEPLTVVTGAPNVKVYETGAPPHRLKVAFATVGARLIDGHKEDGSTLKLKATKIRGIRSEGMVCSEKELGLSDEHEGILYLPPDAPVGMPLVEYIGDQVFSFDIKGPFAHLESVIGVAREAAAMLGKPLKREVLEMVAEKNVRLATDTKWLNLEIADPDLCARYTAAIIRGIRVGPSPFWMQQRLLRAGMRPINNIVDVTNYVMLELGQPLHAFDYDRLRARPGEDTPAIIVRRARPGEMITTLDGAERRLDPQMLLITDGGGPVAIAGVMGGLESEVSQDSVNVLLESANFDFLNNRRTSQKLKLASEASARFGRRVAPELTAKAAARAAWLMADLAGGTVESVFADRYPRKQEQKTITLPMDLVGRVLGVELPLDECAEILESLEFKVRAENQHLQVTVPDYRLDIDIPVDLVEEIGRIHGYDHFPQTLISDELPHQRRNVRLEGTQRVRQLLARCGLDEVITYSMVDIRDDGKMLPGQAQPEADDYVEIRNPIVSDRAHMRRQLLPSLLNTASSNLRYVERVAIFEIARVYHPRPQEILPEEPFHLGLLLTGWREERSWQGDSAREVMDFYDLKGVIEALCSGLGLQDVTWEQGHHPAYHPGRCARFSVSETALGWVGELHPAVRDAFGLPEQPVCGAELDLDVLISFSTGEIQAVIPSVHPPVYEDLAVIVDESTPAVEVRDRIAQAGGPMLRKVELFDVYRGTQIGKGNKSLAYALTYQADDRTLDAASVAKLREKIVNHLAEDLGATLRA